MRTRMLVAAAIAGSLLLLSGAANAQVTGGVITGRVTDARTELPVVGALVVVEGTQLSALAGADGRYRIANVPAGAHTLAVSRLGFGSATQSVTVSVTPEARLTADFRLHPVAIPLEELVVTGVAGGERLRTIGNSVAKIDAVEAVALGAPPSLTNLINARAPGVVVNFSTGRLGAGQSINIRGQSSIGLSNSPLIYVDGVRVNTQNGTGPNFIGGFGGQAASVAGRLNDISPQDIESIEIIRGPAAATVYGTDASSGVIQIITKKGVAGGAPVFSLQAQQGAIWFRDAEGRLPTNYVRSASGEIVPWNALQQEKDGGRALFRTGQARGIEGSVSGGFQQARYYVSASFQDEEGVEPNNTLKQFSLHTNVDVTASEKLDLGASIHFVDLRNSLGADQGASSMLGAIGGHNLLWTTSRGFAFGFPPEVSWELWDNKQNVNRFTTSGTVNHRPTGWLSQRLLVGLDYTGDDSRTLERFAPPALAVYLTPANANGRLGQVLRRGMRYSMDYAATARAGITSSLEAATSVGLQTFRTEETESFLGGTGFPGPGVETVSATAVKLTSTQSESMNTTVGGYIQEKLAWRDRLFLTGAVRVDNNSAFGEDFKWVTYPKADIAWVVSEEPFWRWGNVINALRLRAAYGESGRAPSSFSALRTFSPIQGPGGTNAVTPGSQGNPDLRPERGKEIEAGFEAQIFDRLSVDFTYYNKKTVDQIVNQSVAPSSGFPGSIPLNLARVDNS
ncbi:MAG: TonB-dependent receptor domain-containing protein, partial [Longimicrobiales bacterium]